MMPGEKIALGYLPSTLDPIMLHSGFIAIQPAGCQNIIQPIKETLQENKQTNTSLCFVCLEKKIIFFFSDVKYQVCDYIQN